MERESGLKGVNNTVSRRVLLQSLGAAAITAPFVLRSRSSAAEEPVVIVSWGGSYQEMLESVWAKPFTEQTGIPLQFVSGPDLAKVKAQVQTGNIEWDIFDGTGPQITGGEGEGLWEPIEVSADEADLISPVREFAAPVLLSVGGIGYARSRVSTGAAAKTFADFWNVEGFPGRRGLRTRVSETLEMALLGDGVAPADLYPLDVERAFAALDRIKPAITRWIEQTPQTISLMQNNEVDYVYTYSARAVTAQKSGIDVGFSFDQTLLLNQYFSVLKGSKRKEAATQFINFVLQPDQQAALSTAYGSLPASRSAFGMLGSDVRKNLPNPEDPNNVIVDDSWWSENFVELDRRFKEWLAF